MYSNNRTRKNVNKNKQRNYDRIQHHHLLLRMETKSCPLENDKAEAAQMIHDIVNDIHMKLLAQPHVYYVSIPHYNEGLTAIAPIETSHIAFHFWKKPERRILANKESNCLLEFDIYTCGVLNTGQVNKVLHHLTKYNPTHIDATILNRKWSLTLEKHMNWDLSESNWTDYLRKLNAM